MNRHGTIRNKVVRSVIGAALTVFCGFVLWKSPLGTPLINYSYDELFLFGGRDVTNKVTFIMMDNESYDAFHQTRGQPWDRGLHAQLLNRLAADHCAAVVMDLFFARVRNPQKDQALAGAMKPNRQVVLAAEQALMADPNFDGVRPVLPAEPFYSASRTNWGVAWLDPGPDGIVRHHWPFPSPGPYPSLAETAARGAGATLSEPPRERWVRYYGQEPPWTRLSYSVALQQPTNFFNGQIVFIGTQPKTSVPDNEPDEFQTPYSRWTGQSSAGTDIIITEFLNLVNHEALTRSARLEILVLLLGGAVIGAGLPRMRLLFACGGVILAAIVIVASSAALTAATNYWFPWMLVVVGQLPVAMLWACVCSRAEGLRADHHAPRTERPPAIPGYRLINPAFGQGAYGKVWLARNKLGDWRAIKVISLDRFHNDRSPYDREYEGVNCYRQICDKHPGLLRIEFVSQKLPTHFYYMMELGDAVEPGWQKHPTTYKPRDLNYARSLSPHKRLPIEDCLRVGLDLSDTLDFIHGSGLAHRDIKPQNILFVNGHPKLADLGLITQIRAIDQERTAVGTPGYMPPAPEMPGTPAADIYALGMVLYVISTGRSPTLFPELSETLLGEKDPTEFFLLNNIVLKACQPDPKDRYASAREMHVALEQLKTTVGRTSDQPRR